MLTAYWVLLIFSVGMAVAALAARWHLGRVDDADARRRGRVALLFIVPFLLFAAD